jgi:hypothetical protein
MPSLIDEFEKHILRHQLAQRARATVPVSAESLEFSWGFPDHTDKPPSESSLGARRPPSVYRPSFLTKISRLQNAERVEEEEGEANKTLNATLRRLLRHVLDKKDPFVKNIKPHMNFLLRFLMGQSPKSLENVIRYLVAATPFQEEGWMPEDLREKLGDTIDGLFVNRQNITEMRGALNESLLLLSTSKQAATFAFNCLMRSAFGDRLVDPSLMKKQYEKELEKLAKKPAFKKKNRNREFFARQRKRARA